MTQTARAVRTVGAVVEPVTVQTRPAIETFDAVPVVLVQPQDETKVPAPQVAVAVQLAPVHDAPDTTAELGTIHEGTPADVCPRRPRVAAALFVTCDSYVADDA